MREQKKALKRKEAPISPLLTTEEEDASKLITLIVWTGLPVSRATLP